MRILLFLFTNFAILLVAGVVMSVFGVGNYLTEQGIQYGPLFAMCAIFGFSGALVSLLLSKWLAKKSMGVEIIEESSDTQKQWLLSTVRELAEQARIGVPEVGIFTSDAPNAFATGASKNNALVAVSSGMLSKFPKEEVRAVLGHEIGHVANGDMVTLTLIQGVVNTFVFFFSRIIGHTVDRLVFRSDRPGIGFFITTMIAQVLLSILASVIVMWFSRRREYRADEWGARLAGSSAMIGALKRLRGDSSEAVLSDEISALGISNKKRGGLGRLWSSHPPLEDRIDALERLII